jgi:hypothetical protein
MLEPERCRCPRDASMTWFGQLEADQLPRYREQPGYRGFTVLADHVSGKVIGISY